MTEKLLQYIWQFQHFNKSALQTTDGEQLEIFFPGNINGDQGPDFSNAKIKIANTTLAGSIELHCRSSEWNKHQHDLDKNYKNVVLHVVFQNDVLIDNGIPVLELQTRISKIMLERYDHLMNATSFIACANSIASVKELTWIGWKERLLAERLTRKSSRVIAMLGQSHTHWEEVFWWLLARSFGTKVNADAFEAIARTISINILAKHKNSIHQLEAILLGQANLLNSEFADDYPKLLQREYKFLRTKYQLKPIYQPVHFLRMRPVNFPGLRLAQLAMLIQQSTHLFSKITEEDDVQVIKRWLKLTANDYWHYHYTFDQQTAYKPKTIGAGMIDSIIINTLVPTVFAYGLLHKDQRMKDKALHWLENLLAEKNSITSGFEQIGVSSKSAYDSQALLELKNEYCNKKRCIQCSVGNYLIRN